MLTMDYLNCPDRVKNLYDWLQKYKDYVNGLEASDTLTEEEINNYKNNFFALELLADKYEEARNVYSEYHYKHIMDEVQWIRSVFEEVVNLFQTTGDRSLYLKRITASSLEAVIKVCQDNLHKLNGASLVPSVIATTDSVFETAINDKHSQFIDAYGNIDVERILYKYPDKVKIIRSFVTQAVFKSHMKEGFDADGNLSREYHGKTTRVTIINQQPDMPNAEKQLCCYDWAAMEAIVSLYLEGVHLIDMDSILKVMQHDKGKSISESKKDDRTKGRLFGSLEKLTHNYITIADETCDFNDSGMLVDGEIHIDGATGKVYLEVKSEPILYAHANKLNHINTYDNEEVALELNYNDNTISIYRYLIQAVLSIFGSCKIEDKVKGKQLFKAKNNNKIRVSHICEDILGVGVKDSSKEQTIRKRIPVVLQKMVSLGYISGYTEGGKGSGKYYEVYRDESKN